MCCAASLTPASTPSDPARRARWRARTFFRRKHLIKSSIEIGRYLVSPWAKRLPDSRFAASVSIRSGTGSSTHDRVLRLAPRFDHHDDAIRHALDEGLAWLAEHGVRPQAGTTRAR